jgi:glycosyltransferase involved in cell wall biosynthesis
MAPEADFSETLPPSSSRVPEERTDAPAAVKPPVRQKIAYLLSQYPAVSHTFFLNEVLQLRALGFIIETASINAVSAPADGFPQRERSEASRTFYVKSGSKATLLKTVLGAALSNPGMTWRGLRAALALEPMNLRASLYNLFYLAEAILVGDWMRSKGLDHLHVHFSGPVATVALLTSIAWEIPYSITAHGPDEFYNLDRFYLKEKMRRAKFVFCISNFCRSQLLRLSPTSDWPKFHICRLGVDETMFFPEPAINDPVRLVSVGRLHPSKGFLILLEAVAELKRRGCRISLDVIGGGVDREMLQRFIDRHNLLAEVTLHGAVSHTGARALLKGADIFVLASFAEGVPVALMEAMAMEIACVSTQVAGIPELIRNGVDGILVAPSSVAELVDALQGLVLDPVRRHALASSGRAQVLERYNLQKNVQHLASTFAACLGEAR